MQNKNQSYPVIARESLNKILFQCKLLTEKKKRYSSQSPKHYHQRNRVSLNPINRSGSYSRPKNLQTIPKSTKRKKLYEVVKRRNHHYGPTNASKSNIVFEEQQFKQPRYRTESSIDEGYMIYQKMIEERKKLQDSRRLVVLSKIIKENIKKKNAQIQMKQKMRLRQK